MGKDRDKHPEIENGAAPSKRDHRKSKSSDSEPDPDSDSDSDEQSRKSLGSRKRTKNKKSKRRRRSRDSTSYSSSSEYDDDSYDSDSESDYSEQSDSEEERRRRRKERRRREEKKERRRREKEKDKKRKRKEEEKKRRKKKDKKKGKDKGKKGAVTSSWGKYGIIRETDMWNKRPEFTAWLAEVKKVNMESLANWEEKQLFKDFMEDHNTATFPSKKYYNLDAYYQRKIEKEMKKGFTKVVESERTVFNDEEQRRQELQLERERQKEQQVEELKRSMQSGMAQAMKEQAQLREEMAYQYKLGNFEAAAAIQRRLDPDIAM
ncbi:hypothetical protein Sango_1314500 [Sesamum angolense]|uniref:Uncharacterized protein n=1 Tax=Sesamum angolense TaxID=2727404 RepID=A0AAE2BUV3_9LAMI|nr:hypothetical protein Sango_1314500 [Sesamum angolense]